MKLKHKRTAKYFNAGGTISKVLTGLGGGAEVLGSAINTANDPYSQTALVESDIAAQNNAVAQISGASTFDDLMNLDLNLLSHTRYLDFLPNKLSLAGNIIGASMAGAGTGSSVGGGWGALAGGVIGLGTGIFGNLRAKRNAKRLSRAYNKLIDDINDKLEWMMGNTISDIKSGNLLNATYAAYGGPLAMRYTGNMSPFGNRFSDGGIFIKPSKRGTFTAAAKKHGKSVQAFASQVLANKDNYSPAMVKKANFAHVFGGRHYDDGGPLTDEQYYGIMERVAKENYKNWGFDSPDAAFISVLNDNKYDYRGYYNKYPNSDANSLTHWTDEYKTVYHPTFSDESIYSGKKSKFNPKGLVGGHWVYPDGKEVFIPTDWQRKKAEGGPLVTLGGIWDNGLTYVNNGDTHELNPMDGVLMGMDAQGVPNLVEEGETIWNNYVFSNRLKVPKAVRKKYKLGGSMDLTFADASKYLTKESEERPNDPISQRGLEAGLARLVLELEAIRLELQAPQGIQYARGGLMDDNDNTYFNYRPYDYPVEELPSTGADLSYILRPDENLLPEPKVKSLYGQGYITPSTPKNLTTTTTPPTTNEGTDLTWLRYLPAAGGAFGALQGLFNKPNYGRAKSVAAAANQAGRYRPVSYTPLGNYLTYSPFDIDYASNKSAALASASRRAAVENSGGNRAFATAATIASDYNTLLLLGELYRLAEAYNLNLRKTIADYNRGTDTTNAELGLKAAMANQEAMMKANQSRLSGITLAVGMMDAVDQARGAGISANLSNLFNSLGDIGKEEFARNMVISNPGLYYSLDRNGKVVYKDDYYNLSEYEKDKVREDARRRGGTV